MAEPARRAASELRTRVRTGGDEQQQAQGITDDAGGNEQRAGRQDEAAIGQWGDRLAASVQFSGDFFGNLETLAANKGYSEETGADNYAEDRPETPSLTGADQQRQL